MSIVAKRSPISATAELVCTAHPFTQAPHPMLYNAFQSARHPKVPPPIGASTPDEIHVHWTYPAQNIRLQVARFSRFGRLAAESPYTSQCALKRD